MRCGTAGSVVARISKLEARETRSFMTNMAVFSGYGRIGRIETAPPPLGGGEANSSYRRKSKNLHAKTPLLELPHPIRRIRAAFPEPDTGPPPSPGLPHPQHPPAGDSVDPAAALNQASLAPTLSPAEDCSRIPGVVSSKEKRPLTRALFNRSRMPSRVRL